MKKYSRGDEVLNVFGFCRIVFCDGGGKEIVSSDGGSKIRKIGVARIRAVGKLFISGVDFSRYTAAISVTLRVGVP